MGHLRKYGESPTDQLTTESEELVLDYEIKFQRPNGSWEPTGTGGQYEYHWSVVHAEWSGYLTLLNILAFSAWDRLDT